MIAEQEIATPLSRAHQQALARAVHVLENPNFAARLADYEREYGADTVRLHYAELAARSPQARK
jgi:hypothetical protein